MADSAQVRILFVCMGNICRSPARRRGLDMDHLRARKVSAADIEAFDLVVAMDNANLEALQQICPAGHEEKLTLFMRFAPNFGRDEVPDPYYGGPNGFELVFDMVEEASRGLLEHLRAQHGL